jgi:uncharacterized protein (TIGR00156 family)
MRSIHFPTASFAKLSASIAVALMVLLTGPAQAQFSGPSQKITTTVQQANTTRLGREISLEGFIVKHLRGEYYLFRDATGEIRVEIERPIWRGRKVNPKTKVRIQGDVDRDLRGRYISVERLQVLP